MLRSSIKRILLLLVLLLTVGGTALRVVPVAHAGPAIPKIVAVADAKAYGVMLVKGYDFTPNTTATIQVRDTFTGAVLATVTVGVDKAGTFTKMVSIPTATYPALAEMVTIQVTDASQAVTEELLLPLSAQLAQLRMKLPAAQEALAVVLKSGAEPAAVAPYQHTVMALQQKVLPPTVATEPAPVTAVYGKTISAIADSMAYGVILVKGHDLTPNTTATIHVRDASTSAVLATVTVGVDKAGTFAKMVSIPPTADPALAVKVTIRVTDASQASEEVALQLSSQLTLTQQQMVGAQKALADGVKDGVSAERLMMLRTVVIDCQDQLIDLMGLEN